MKSLIHYIKRGIWYYGCCPGHDIFPRETYRSRLSKKARARGKKKEARYVRRILKGRTEEDV